jgi:hypothetical protein
MMDVSSKQQEQGEGLCWVVMIIVRVMPIKQ